ncbi:MAG: 3'(2'),5'-bisphosphate nucleotidase CysQ [Acidobacteriota bacterium]|nr:3'(2'),5'-bisphosphate nucleotidase CysQ [Acidobacteriota bacterium]
MIVEILERIEEALRAAEAVLEGYTPGRIAARAKAGGDPVTEADIEVNTRLHEILPRPGEGWLSEETRDDRDRLSCRNVWVVDPIDGTKEFVMGLPEWCVSIGWVEDGEAVAGGILNPAAGHLILGSFETGVTLNGREVAPRSTSSLEDALVLASRSEVTRGEWRAYQEREFTVRPMGSVAYKLGLVAAGLADATWTLVPKHEWDVAAGSALVQAAGGSIFIPTDQDLHFNRHTPKLPGLVALAAGTERLWAAESFELSA